ncbi:hypothetical protein ABPG74_022470 [Tetrahymena malaccensis]
MKYSKAFSLVVFFLEDIYQFRGLYQQQEQEIEDNNTQLHILNGMNGEDFQKEYSRLFDILLASNLILIPPKIITFVWSVDNETLKTNFIGIYVIISFAIDFWMDEHFFLDDLIHINAYGLPNPYKIEIDNLYDLKRNISEYENQKNQSFYKNLETVEIYIQIQDFANQSELVNCLFCAFGKSEINSSSYQRKYLQQSKYFQKIIILDYLIANNFETGTQNCKILPQIVQLEAFITHKDSIQLTKKLFDGNCLVKLFNLDLDNGQDMSSINSYNQYVLSIQNTLMYNQIVDKGVSSLGSALANCTNLTNLTLQLMYNQIGDVGASGLGSAIVNCTNLTNFTLYLCNNYIGDKGASGLGSALAKCTNLSNLTLNLQQKQFISFGL